jgi:hypothetical protein
MGPKKKDKKGKKAEEVVVEESGAEIVCHVALQISHRRR